MTRRRRQACRLLLALTMSLAAAPCAIAQGGPTPASTASAPVSVPAAQAAPTPAAESSGLSFFKQIALSGFTDVYFGYNFNTPSTGQAQLRAFDVQHNSFSLNLAELALEKKPTSDSRGGFRVDLDYGPTATMVHAAEPGGTRTFQNILQAYASYLAPVGHGLQFDIGKFTTPVGNESIKTRDNWNYSRSVLFTVAEPNYHAGVRVSYSVNDRISLAAHLVNGWNDVVDNNGGKTVGVQATLKPSTAFTIVQSYLGGPEQTNDNADWRHLVDTVITYTATPTVSLALNYDYGRDTVAASTVTWQGVAGYLRYRPNPRFALTPRAEYYDDPNGSTTGVVQKIKEVTLTTEFTPTDGVVFRVEYRRDVSDAPFFQKNVSSVLRHQDTLTAGIIYAFSSGRQ